MKHAVIDMGSNTIRLIVFEVDDDAPFSSAPGIAMNKKAMAGLASYVSDGVLNDDGIARAVKIVGKHVDAARLAGVQTISVFATAILRNIENGETVRQTIEESVGLPIDLLSGDDEARLGFRGCCCNTDASEALVVDIGGGSTELSILREGIGPFPSSGGNPDIDLANDLVVTSIPVGSLKMFLSYVSEVLPTRNEARVVRSFMSEHVQDTGVLGGRHVKTVIGLGGTARSSVKLVHALFDAGDDVLVATREQLEELLELPTTDFRRALLGVVRLCPDRVHTVLVGLAMLLGVMDRAGADMLRVSKQGIREGYLLERVLKGQG